MTYKRKIKVNKVRFNYFKKNYIFLSSKNILLSKKRITGFKFFFSLNSNKKGIKKSKLPILVGATAKQIMIYLLL